MARKKHLLFVQVGTEPLGGKEAVFAWALQSACSTYEVTVFTWGASVNTAGFNRQYGSSLHRGDFHLKRPGVMMRALCRLIAALDPDPASIQPAVLLMRSAKRISPGYDLAIGCEMETDFGVPGLQYIHYPWLEAFAPALAAFEDLRGWRKVKAFLSGQIRPWMWLGDFSLRRMRASRTLANSDWTRGRVQAAYALESATLHPPAPGVFSSVPWAEKENGFLCIGRIHPNKRIDWLIETLEPLRSEVPGLRLHIVGTIGDRAEDLRYFKLLQRKLASRADWIAIYPDLSREELDDLAVRQRYGVHAMIDEHFGIAIAEMMRAGCIPFVHDSGGAPEVVGRDPRLLYQSAEELRSRILRVVRTPEEQQALSTGLKSAAERFSPERFMGCFLKHVESSLNAQARE
jgi:glycosyltransferase involved in cell wall biosynthesis